MIAFPRFFKFRRYGKRWLAVVAVAGASLALITVDNSYSQDQAKAEARLAELRKDPRRFAVFAAEAKNLFALAEERQKALRKLDAEVQKLDPGERARLLAAMNR